ncbi:hypothetical protein ES703_42235 [subsurface metagenome]
MLNKRFWVVLGLVILVFIVYSSSLGNLDCRPFRVVVIIGDQWIDPMSYMVTTQIDTEYERGVISTRYEGMDYSGYRREPDIPNPVDFYNLMILLKSWGIPFDVVRLDQQFLDRNMFIGVDGKPMYGVVIWDVNESDKLLHPDYDIIKEIVSEYGIGLIAISDRIQQPEIQDLLGIKYKGSWMSNTKLNIIREHFLTKDLKSPLDYIDRGYKQRVQVELKKGTTTLVKQGPYPQITARTLSSGSRVVWIGSDYNVMFSYQEIRTLLRRAITWTIGYNLYKTWDNKGILIIDDPGAAQCAWLEHWHYPTLTEENIEHYLIKPLQEHNAVLNINIVSGFVNDKKRRVEPSWEQNFVDEFNVKQNYISTKKGIDKGINLGVFEIMCHGLTHMQPDLSSNPTWWDSDLDKERAEVGWYREFGDTRRGKEIPAAEQFWRMKTAKQWLEYQFGVIPLEFCAGGGGCSISYPNNTWRLAARAGFGWYGWTNGYLGQDMVIIGWDFFGTHEAPIFVGAPPNGHDFGIAREPEKFTTIFEEYPGVHFIGINEFIGYLHANNSGRLTKEDNLKLELTIQYDDHYCWHFKDHSSKWTFEISDWMEKNIGEELIVTVDGIKLPELESSIEPFDIPIPAGIGEHCIKIEHK